VPHTLVRRALAVLADEHTVRILDGTTEVARHPRSWSRVEQIEQDRHVQALVAHKRQARAHRAVDRLAQAAPASQTLLQRHDAAAVQAAILEALDRGVPHPNAVRLALERAREAAGQPPPVALVLPAHVARCDAPVQAHDLASYDPPEHPHE
jgi:uncharacterized protein with PIN domain